LRQKAFKQQIQKGDFSLHHLNFGSNLDPYFSSLDSSNPHYSMILPPQLIVSPFPLQHLNFTCNLLSQPYSAALSSDHHYWKRNTISTAKRLPYFPSSTFLLQLYLTPVIILRIFFSYNGW
jgi:hypothetical protein